MTELSLAFETLPRVDHRHRTATWLFEGVGGSTWTRVGNAHVKLQRNRPMSSCLSLLTPKPRGHAGRAPGAPGDVGPGVSLCDTYILPCPFLEFYKRDELFLY